jgi:hypothetical protein
VPSCSAYFECVQFKQPEAPLSQLAPNGLTPCLRPFPAGRYIFDVMHDMPRQEKSVRIKFGALAGTVDTWSGGRAQRQVPCESGSAAIVALDEHVPGCAFPSPSMRPATYLRACACFFAEPS